MSSQEQPTIPSIEFSESVQLEAEAALGPIALNEVHIESPESPLLKIGVLKRVAKYDGSENNKFAGDGLEFKDDDQDLTRTIRNFTGNKDRRMQILLMDALNHIALNPKGYGSATIKGRDRGESAPIYDHKRVQLWRFKPTEAVGLSNSFALRAVRIVYTVVELEDGQSALGIIDIINRGDFEKKYN